MMAIAQRLRLFIDESLSWLFVAYLIFAGYVIFDVVTFAVNNATDPRIGRVSSLICKKAPSEMTTCTVTIYGFRGLYQQSFPAEKFEGAFTSFLITGDSYKARSGIDIKIGRNKYIPFVHRTQGRSIRLVQTVEQINNLFEDKASASGMIFYNGLNSGMYYFLFGRFVLLVNGLVIVWAYGKHKRSEITDKTNTPERSNSTFMQDTFSWWKINLLARGSFYLYLVIPYIISLFLPYPQSWVEASVFETHPCLDSLPASPLSNIFCLYPFLALTTLQACVQWHYLRQKASISAWWVIAPILAGAPLLFVKLPTLSSCYTCQVFKLILSGWYPFVFFNLSWNHKIIWQFSSEVDVLAWLLVYLLLLGSAQWLVLRHRLKFTISWVFIPAINAVTLLASSLLLQIPDIFPNSIPDILMYPALFLLAFGMQDIISGLVITKILHANAADKPELLPTSTP